MNRPQPDAPAPPDPNAAAGPDLFGARLAARLGSLSPASRRVAAFIDANRTMVLASTAMDVAARTGTSDATVVRTVQGLGFTGLGALKQALVAALSPVSTPADDMRRTLDEAGADTARAIDLVFETHDEALAALREPAARAGIVAAVAALHGARRIVTFGIGPSASLARYVAMLLARAGRASKALDSAGIMLADQLLDLREGDAVLALAYGRPYREVAAVFAEARRLGLVLVLVTDDPASRLARDADVVLAARRGRTARVALHAATLVVLEALVLGLAAIDRSGAMAALQRLNDLRQAVSGQHIDVG